MLPLVKLASMLVPVCYKIQFDIDQVSFLHGLYRVRRKNFQSIINTSTLTQPLSSLLKMSFASVSEISSRARTCVKYEALVVFPVWLHPVSDQMILRCSTFMSDLLSSPVCVFQSSLSTLDQPFAPVAPLKIPLPLTQPNRKNKLDPSDS